LLEQQSFGFSAQEEEMLNELSDEFSDSWLDDSDELENDAAVGDSFDIRTVLDELQDSWDDGDDGERQTAREKVSVEVIHEIGQRRYQCKPHRTRTPRRSKIAQNT